ncbi:TetR family transcriptional regulator, partial [Citrobacter freundii]|nr:TetR family transcriptional regulator [Citrobacter freundii]
APAFLPGLESLTRGFEVQLTALLQIVGGDKLIIPFC